MKRMTGCKGNGGGKGEKGDRMRDSREEKLKGMMRLQE